MVFRGSYSSQDDAAADDFVVTGAGCKISSVYIGWQLNNNPTITAGRGNFNVSFYRNAGGLPGALVAAFERVSITENGGNVIATLDTPLDLTPDTYWIGGTFLEGSVVPEPGSLALVGAGLIAPLGRTRNVRLRTDSELNKQ